MRRLKCNEYSPTVLSLPDTRHPLPRFPKRCRSSHLPSLGHWNTHWDLTSSALPAEYAPAAATLFKQVPLLAPTGRRNQAVYSTSARTPISLSSRIQAPHITGQLNTHWDLTSSAMPTGCASADATRRSLPRQRADSAAATGCALADRHVQDRCSRTRAAPPCRGWRPGTRSTAARGWRRRACPRTPSWSRRRAARCRTACRWARGRWLRYRTLS